MKRIYRSLLLAVAAVSLTDVAHGGGEPAAEKIDATEVRRRIAVLAEPDETVSYEERAVNWLSHRRELIVPQLIAALDDRDPKIAEQCLDILRKVGPRQDLTDALVAKAGDQHSPLRYKALRQLEKSADDPRVVRLLDRASTQAKIFPDPRVRARWSWLAGHPDRAVDILKPLVEKFDAGDNHKEDYKIVEAIRLLGEIGEPASIELLKSVAAGDRWQLAVEAYQALAKIDPQHHGLTQDQATLLKGWRNFKETDENFRQRMLELAKMNVQELRPLVMQMLRNEDGGIKGSPGHGQRAALMILAAWKDKEALPQIREIMQEKRSPNRREAVTAYLATDNGQQAQQTVLNLPEYEAVLRGIVAAPIPAERKVTILRAARANLNIPYAVPHALRHERHQDQDIRELLVPLMDQETSLLTLAGYCELAADDKEQRFADQVRRAMKILARNPAVSQSNEKDTPSAAATILRAVATYGLKDVAPDVQKLMDSENATIRAAAQATGARLLVPVAMEKLHAQLGEADATLREQAAQSMLSIPPIDEAERAAREEAMLTHLGKPSEDYALQVLSTCGGERSVEALEAVLNDADARRAVYAAWVLAQLSDKTAAQIGLRRVAIFALFHHQIYQQGAGIDFEMAPRLNFHQTTQRLNRNPQAESAPKPPVRIPDDLLKPFDWDDEEQEYAVRCYQLAELVGNRHGLSTHFLNGGMMGHPGRIVLNRTHLPLLKEIAAHDSRLDRLMVQGQTVAHFSYRQLAAQAIAEITSEKAVYLGLTGETIDSQNFPQPYQNQDRLLAKFFVDRIQHARLADNPRTDRQWDAFEIHRNYAHLCKDKFGPQVLSAIREEARQRKVDIKHILPATGS